MLVPATHLDFDGINDYVNCGNAPTVQISGNAITLKPEFSSILLQVLLMTEVSLIKNQKSPDYG